MKKTNIIFGKSTFVSMKESNLLNNNKYLMRNGGFYVNRFQNL